MTAGRKHTAHRAAFVLGVWALLAAGGAARAQDATGSAAASAQTSGTASAPTSSPTTQTGDLALQKTLQDTYNKCVAATKKRDESVLAQVRARDFVYKEASGKTYTRDQVEDSERRALAQVQTVDAVSTTVDSARRDGSSRATATVRQSFTGTIVDAQNKTHKISLSTTTRDVWTQSKDGWKLQSVQVMGRQGLRDGKPFDPAAATANNSRNGAQASRGANGYGNRSGGSYSGYHAPVYRLRRFHAPKIKGVGRRVTLP